MNSIMMYTVISKYIHLGKVPIYFQQDYCMIDIKNIVFDGVL